MNTDEYSETLSEGSFATVVLGGILTGLEGLGGFAARELNPLALAPGGFSSFVDGFYLLVGLAALHQLYFGYSSFKKLLEFENPWES
ncbi:MAG: hypothetical protein ABEJ03_02330 [Candidatus Nanohaloarchaea archaeon]